MATLVTMPKLGLTMNSGSVSEWKKKEGDAVGKGEILFVAATDKLTFDVEAPEEGVLLATLVALNEDVKVGAPLAVIGEEGEDYMSLLGEVESQKPQETRQENSSSFDVHAEQEKKSETKGFTKASPLAKKTAKDFGVDISLVEGTGPEGRIVKKDVIAFVQSVSVSSKVKASPVAERMAADLGVNLIDIEKQGRIMKEDVIFASQGKTAASTPARYVFPAEDRRIPLTNMRKVIGERMLLSTTTIPTVTYNMEVDFSALISLRKNIKEAALKQDVKISYNHILMKICAQVLTEYPMANASLDGQEIILHGNVNIGLAVAVEGGLVVPNVKAVQAKSLLQIASETDDMVARTRENQLELEEMQGGTFTISNLGMFGMHSFTPIVNPPEACILAVNAIVDRPMVIDGEIQVRPISMLCLTADHRLVDGADAAKFLVRVKELIENPYLLLL